MIFFSGGVQPKGLGRGLAQSESETMFLSLRATSNDVKLHISVDGDF